MPFGAHKGQVLRAIPMAELMSSVQWVRDKMKFLKFRSAANDWLETLAAPGGAPIRTREVA
jgi:hypothetical protein